jgi:hypothetical protein
MRSDIQKEITNELNYYVCRKQKGSYININGL